jgi:hypothetical protein
MLSKKNYPWTFGPLVILYVFRDLSKFVPFFRAISGQKAKMGDGGKHKFSRRQYTRA